MLFLVLNMEENVMKKKLNYFMYILIILFLLPYIVTVFINGKDVNKERDVKNPYVTVTIKGKQKEVERSDYLAGLVVKEIDPFYSEEAIKAQAVVTRTNLYRKNEYTEEYITVEDMKKRWGETKGGRIYKKIKNAVEETKGQVLMYDGKPIQASFHSLSNGKTRNADEAIKKSNYPYLTLKECPKDLESGLQIQTLTLSYTEAKEYCAPILKASSQEESKKQYQFEDFEIVSCDSAGYVLEVRIGDQIYAGEEIRQVLDLPSACFTFQDFEGNLKITTQGVGHGIGMSQYTAHQMAEEGKKYEEILQFFYEGTTINEVTEIL